jgi:hypothetical protein
LITDINVATADVKDASQIVLGMHTITALGETLRSVQHAIRLKTELAQVETPPRFVD